MCISLFGISIKELLNGIGSSNYFDRENLLEEINNTPTKIIKASNDRLGDIENAPAKIEGDKEEYVTFGELPDGMILDVNTDQGKGVECLIGKYRRYYSKIRKQSLIDLYLSKEDGAERLKEDINKFCQQFKSYDNIENFINGVKKENEKRSAKRTMRQIFGALVLGVVLLIGLSSILSTLIGGPADETSQILSACCGGFDLIVGIVFFAIERYEDKKEKEREEKISNAQSELFKAVRSAKTAAMLSKEAAQLTSKLGDTLSNTTDKLNSTLDSTLRQTSTINENLQATINKTSTANTELGTILQELTKKTEKAKKELEIERENLGICEQCHVPLGQVCNVCGHKYSTPLPMEEENVYIPKRSDEFGYRVIEVDKKVAILVCDAEKINLSKIYEKSQNTDIGNSYRIRPTNISWVKRIVFTSAVQNIVLDDNGSIDSLKSLFPGVNIVGFAKPENGLKQYHLGKNVFNKMNDIEIRGLEYIAAGDAGCFGSWKREDIKTINPSLNNICFE